MSSLSIHHHLLTPRGYNAGGETFTLVARVLVRLLAFILFFVWLVILLRSTMPYLTHLFASGVSSFTLMSIPTVFIASLLMGGSIYLLIVLARFMVLRRRLFSSNIVD
jgi:hypothetical protein